jgi:hypothetical protein
MWSYYVTALSLFISRQLFPQSKVGIHMGGYCNPTHFQIRGSLVQKWMLLLYVCEFICRLILMGFFF